MKKQESEARSQESESKHCGTKTKDLQKTKAKKNKAVKALMCSLPDELRSRHCEGHKSCIMHRGSILNFCHLNFGFV
jgi:hypothetical protein